MCIISLYSLSEIYNSENNLIPIFLMPENKKFIYLFELNHFIKYLASLKQRGKELILPQTKEVIDGKTLNFANMLISILKLSREKENLVNLFNPFK